jgi:hypothetical protein
MNSFIGSRLPALTLFAASLALTACGGGGGGDSSTGTGASPTTPPTGAPVTPPTTAAATTPGVWKGSILSTTTGQTSPIVALTGLDGHSVWMTTDGRVWGGQVPMSGDRFDTTFGGHMYDGVHFPDGTNHGTTSMMVDHHSATVTNGRYAGNGDAGTFDMSLSPMWDRPASIGTVAGVYTRTTSNGYTMTMTMSANGQLTASDSLGCLINGSVGVPDATHNMYSLNAAVTSCGSLDGTYSGMGALLDADAMQDWMTSMHPLEHGGHSHGGSMMGGSPRMGHNTVPTGQRNLFMFSMVNDHNAIMDALAR